MKIKINRLVALLLSTIMLVSCFQDFQLFSASAVVNPNVIYEQSFDNLDSVTVGADSSNICMKSATFDGTISLSDNIFRGNMGKSLKIDGRTVYKDRIKFHNTFEGAVIGNTYLVSAYVYTTQTASDICFGAYEDGGIYSSVPIAYNMKISVEANTWTKIEFELKYENSKIIQLGIGQGVQDSEEEGVSTIYIDDIKVEKKDPDILYSQNFDSLNNVAVGTTNRDLLMKAGGFGGTVTLDDTVFHGGSGKSIKMTGRTVKKNKLKFHNAFVGAAEGETYVVSAWVYVPEAAEEVRLGIYGIEGSYVVTPLQHQTKSVEANTWTKFEFEYTYSVSHKISQIGIGQREVEGTVVATIYVDDLMVSKKKTASQPQPEPEQPEGVLLDIAFDSMSTLKIGTSTSDLAMKAGGFAGTVALDDTVFHGNSGKSIKIDNRAALKNKLKFHNAFVGAEEGETYVISAWVYIPAAGEVRVGLYGTTGEYQVNPIKADTKIVEANTWTKFEFEYTYKATDEITQVGIGQNDWGSSAVVPTIYVDDIKVEKKEAMAQPEPEQPEGVLLDIDFDSISALKIGTGTSDLAMKAGGFAGTVALDDTVFHGNSGKSIKIDNRAALKNKLKFHNAFVGAEEGETYVISAWVYIPAAGEVRVGLYGTTGEYQVNPIKANTKIVKANTWTKFEFEYTYKATDEITQVGIGQNDWGSSAVVPTIYVDDIKVKKGKIKIPETPALPQGTIYNQSFDWLEELAIGSEPTDIAMTAGGYSGMVTLDNTIFHGNSGKSIMMDNRTAKRNKLKFHNVFANAVEGKTYTISAWVYTTEDAEEVRLGLYGTEGEYILVPKVEHTMDVEAKTWTKFEIKYTYSSKDNLTQIGIGQREVDGLVVKTMYVDDIDVSEYKKPESKTLPSGVLYHETFDDMDILSVGMNDTDFCMKSGNFAKGKLTLTGKVFNGIRGKALKIDNRASFDNRVKFWNVFKDAKVGETYSITVWVYTEEATKYIRLGLYTDSNGSSPTIPLAESTKIKMPAKTWVKLEIVYTYENTEITQIGIDQSKDGKLISTIYVDDILVKKFNEETEKKLPDGTLYSQNFDNLDTIRVGTGYASTDKDFCFRTGSYQENVDLTSTLDHTTGHGKCLIMEDRTELGHRLKFKNTFNGAVLNETYSITAWVYTEREAEGIRFAAYTDTNGKYPVAPVTGDIRTLPAKTWTKMYFEYTWTDEEITQIGFDQTIQRPLIGDEDLVAPTIYIDDITIVRNDNASTEGVIYPFPVTQREGKRPTPLVTDRGNTYDDLIFFERITEVDYRDSEQLYEALPSNPIVLADENDLFKCGIKNPQYSSKEIVDVQGMPFKKAVRTTVNEIPDVPWNTQLELPLMDETNWKGGDSILIICYMRTISVDNDTGSGRANITIEQPYKWDKVFKYGDMMVPVGGEWQKYYFRYTAKSATEPYSSIKIRTGYQRQTIEIGGLQILNYGKDVDIKDLPSMAGGIEYSPDNPTFYDKDAEWRKEAWERIEKIRMGDINVIVKDATGKVIPNAEVKIDMYEHEFEWGTTVFEGMICPATSDVQTFRGGLSALFNSVVPGNGMLWSDYEKNKEIAKKEIDICKKLKIPNYRGHTLVWDGKAMPENFPTLFKQETFLDVFNRVRDHIYEQATDFSGYLTDWVVINEPNGDNVMRKAYGDTFATQWVKWAAEADPYAKLYINETHIPAGHAQGPIDIANLQDLRKKIEEEGGKVDGLGAQGHTGTFYPPEELYKELEQLSNGVKEIRITEFDTTASMHEDPEAEASFFRDYLITCFSAEKMVGFNIWSPVDQWTELHNGVIFDRDFNLKLTGQQFVDLVYNKWWTQETGKTNNKGKYSTRGYYGDYLITATVDGRSVTVDKSFRKGDSDTIEITMFDPEFKHSISIDPELSVGYAIAKSQLNDYKLDTAKLTYEMDYYPQLKEGVSTKSIPKKGEIKNWQTININGEEYIYFNLNGIDASEMSSEIRAQLHIENSNDKECVSNVDVYSIREYARSMVNNENSDEKLKSLLIDLLNYGSAAQRYFKRNGGDPANKVLTFAQIDSSDVSDISYSNNKLEKIVKDYIAETNISLKLASKPTVHLRLKTTNKFNLKKITAEIEVNGKKIKLSNKDFEFDEDNKYCYLTIDMLELGSIDEKFILKIKQNEKTIGTFEYSINSYGNSKVVANDSALKTLFNTMLKLYSSSNALVESK